MKFQDILKSLNEASEPKLEFDLKDDLVYYMNNDGQFYRRQYYPFLLSFKKAVDAKKSITPAAFESLVRQGYEEYTKKFPHPLIKKDIDEDFCKEMCESLYERELAHIEKGIYEK